MGRAPHVAAAVLLTYHLIDHFVTDVCGEYTRTRHVAKVIMCFLDLWSALPETRRIVHPGFISGSCERDLQIHHRLA
ncbi:hypothetical protein F4801DRAFT_528655 [Xylaria longipes]|nr:hypothetical protein F4801DRAFT_528655 [Xylaria longipes]